MRAEFSPAPGGGCAVGWPERGGQRANAAQPHLATVAATADVAQVPVPGSGRPVQPRHGRRMRLLPCARLPAAPHPARFGAARPAPAAIATGSAPQGGRVVQRSPPVGRAAPPVVCRQQSARALPWAELPVTARTPSVAHRRTEATARPPTIRKPVPAAFADRRRSGPAMRRGVRASQRTTTRPASAIRSTSSSRSRSSRLGSTSYSSMRMS